MRECPKCHKDFPEHDFEGERGPTKQCFDCRQTNTLWMQTKRRSRDGYGRMRVAERDVDWQARAACRDCDEPEIFFLLSSEAVQRAVKYCAECPVFADCAAYGAKEKYGVWAGVSKEMVVLQKFGLVASCGEHSSEFRCDECRRLDREKKARQRFERAQREAGEILGGVA